MRRLLPFFFLFLSLWPAQAQTTNGLCTWALVGGIATCTNVTAGSPLPVTGSFSLTFPPIGAAVPSTGVYDAINVGGTLRGLSGLATGSLYSGAVAIVDGSGTQITSFGSTTPLAPVAPTSPTATNSTLVGCQYVAAGVTFTNLQQGSVLCNSAGSLLVSNSGSNVGGYDFQISPTITVQNASYSAGNSEGGLITVTGVARTNGGSGALNGLRIKSTGGSTNTIWVYAWSKTPVSTCTDKSAFVASASDAPYAIVGFPTSGTLGNSPGTWDTSTYIQVNGLIANFKNQDSSPGTAIYVCLVTAGTVTPATTGDLTAVFSGMQD